MINRLATGCRRVTLAVLIIGTVGASADDTVQIKLDKLGYRQADAVEKIQDYRVNGWNYIDSKHIVIYAGPSRRYLITTLNECADLSAAEHISFSSTANYLTKLDKLIVRGSGGFKQNCPIGEIHQLEKIKK